MPRAQAHRPFPSMMIATWSPEAGGRVKALASIKSATKKKMRVESTIECVACRVNERFHVIQIPLQGAPAGRREPVLGLGTTPLERLGHRHVARFLELARVHAQVP